MFVNHVLFMTNMFLIIVCECWFDFLNIFDNWKPGDANRWISHFPMESNFKKCISNGVNLQEIGRFASTEVFSSLGNHLHRWEPLQRNGCVVYHEFKNWGCGRTFSWFPNFKNGVFLDIFFGKMMFFWKKNLNKHHFQNAAYSTFLAS